MARIKLILASALLAIFLMGAAVAYEHENNGPINGGIYVDDNGNYSLNVEYYIPMSAIEQKALEDKFNNQTILNATVLLVNLSTMNEATWHISFIGTGYAKNGIVRLYSKLDHSGPNQEANENWELIRLEGIEVITQTPYLRW